MPLHLHVIARTESDGVLWGFVDVPLFFYEAVCQREIVFQSQIFASEGDIAIHEQLVVEFGGGHTADTQADTLGGVIADKVVDRANVEAAILPVGGGGNIARTEDFGGLLQRLVGGQSA